MSENNVASRGDFRGDFSRDSFDPMKHFSRVLMQQGRVQLDADWNEQVSILLHYMRQLGRDLTGPHGTPKDDDGNTGRGFEIKDQGSDFSIGFGRYYVNGIPCENDKEDKLTYFTQRPKPEGQFVVEKQNRLKDGSYLIYLDALERHLTYVEDDDIREKALGGADTASRAQIVWQVKVIPSTTISKDSKYSEFITALTGDKKKGTLKAQAKRTEVHKEPCLTSPDSTYRGTENQLYRVEIHNSSSDADGPTFKWSRENGSVIFPIRYIADKIISLEHLGRDDRFSLQTGDWVEVLDDDVILRNEAHPLLQVKEVDREECCVTLELNDDTKDTAELLAVIAKDIKEKNDKHPYLRRWDQKKGAASKGVEVTEDEKEQDWISIEDGLEIQFQEQNTAAVLHQTGDYWLIPARIATGDVEWPEEDNGQPKALPPHGVVHHYAPLAIITVAGGNVTVDHDLRRQLHCGWIPIS